MPDDAQHNGSHHPPPGNDVSGDINVSRARLYTIPGQAGFLPGNPGRPRGSGNKAKSAHEIIELFGTEPLALKMQQMQRLQKRIDNDQFEDSYARIETEKLLDKVTADVMQYRHQRLKSVEHHAQLEIIQQLQQLDTLSDEQMKALMDQAEELMKQLPPGR